jgi:hypothetical protein
MPENSHTKDNTINPVLNFNHIHSQKSVINDYLVKELEYSIMTISKNSHSHNLSSMTTDNQTVSG